MTCESARAQTGAYIDDELDGPSLAELEAHFKRCTTCGRAAQALAGLQALVRASAPALPPAEPAAPSAPRLRPGIAGYAVAAAILLMLFVSFQARTVSPARTAASAEQLGPVMDQRPDQAGLDCRLGARGSSCEIQTPASFCSSARDCGLP